ASPPRRRARCVHRSRSGASRRTGFPGSWRAARGETGWARRRHVTPRTRGPGSERTGVPHFRVVGTRVRTTSSGGGAGMADGHDSGRGDSGTPEADPLERYFRPRPGSHAAAGDADADIEGVTIDGMPAPRATVEGARRQKRFLMVTGTMSAFVLLTSGGAWAFQNYVTGMIDKVSVGGLGRDGPKGPKTILVAGVDRRDGLTKAQQKAARLGHHEGERSDTMLLVHVSKDRDRVSVVNLPRDSYVTIPAHES